MHSTSCLYSHSHVRTDITYRYYINDQPQSKNQVGVFSPFICVFQLIQIISWHEQVKIKQTYLADGAHEGYIFTIMVFPELRASLVSTRVSFLATPWCFLCVAIQVILVPVFVNVLQYRMKFINITFDTSCSIHVHNPKGHFNVLACKFNSCSFYGGCLRSSLWLDSYTWVYKKRNVTAGN